MSAGQPLRVLIAAPQVAPTPEGPGWWTQITAFTSIVVSAAIIGAAVFLLLNLRRQKRALPDSAGTYAGRLAWRRAADDRAEWIRRTQWALGAAASSNDTRHFYGITILEALARSDLTGLADKAILDTVWAGSFTKMRDNEIRRLITECGAVFEREKAESTLSNSVQRAAAREGERPDRLGSGEDEATRRSLEGNATRADPTTKDQVFATLRREVLAARLKVTLDEQLGRDTSPPVRRLADMNLPPVGGSEWRKLG